MHIPDGYLSPSTCLVLGAVMLPIWYKASGKLKKDLDVKQVPLLSMGAVFCFLIMMFNVPIPNGTTAHAIGATLVAIIFGPWAAVIAMSVALAIQAIVFADGGILAFGANAFNMAFIAPFVGYYVYKLISKNAMPGSTRQLAAGAIAGYAAINCAALVASIEFGIQPLFFTATDGTPLYCPYGLDIAIPAMMVAHLTIAGFIEGIVTAAALKFMAVQPTVILQSQINKNEEVL